MEQTCASPRRSRGQRRPPAPSSQARHRLRQVQRRISSRSSKCERSLAASVRRVQHWHLHYHAQPACHKRAACLYTRPTAAPMRALTWCATKGASAHRGAGRETRCGLSGFLVLRHASFCSPRAGNFVFAAPASSGASGSCDKGSPHPPLPPPASRPVAPRVDNLGPSKAQITLTEPKTLSMQSLFTCHLLMGLSFPCISHALGGCSRLLPPAMWPVHGLNGAVQLQTPSLLLVKSARALPTRLKAFYSVRGRSACASI